MDIVAVNVNFSCTFYSGQHLYTATTAPLGGQVLIGQAAVVSRCQQTAVITLGTAHISPILASSLYVSSRPGHVKSSGGVQLC